MNDCKYCGDSILKFQIKAHDGCARLAGAREMVDYAGFSTAIEDLRGL